jgi:glycine/D-amino acid oxidase-like deaminating enzyme/nitrite reductase/ring-hydroxylating ferredoxin subunit
VTADTSRLDLGEAGAPYAPLPPERTALPAGTHRADVVVVGGGIVGVTAALRLAERGLDVVLLDKHRVAGGTSGGSTGKVTSQHGAVYAQLLKRHGRDVAAFYADRNQAAVHTIAELVTRHGIDCQLETVATHLHATTGSGAGQLRDEFAAAQQLGLPATLTDDAPVPDAVLAGLRFDDQRQFDPRAYVVGLAAAAERLGVRIHEASPARRVRPRGDEVVVHTDDGEVVARHAVLATLLPWPDTVAAFARATPSRAVCVAAELTGPVPADPSLGVDGPSRSTRRFVGADGRERLILLASGWRPGAQDEAATLQELAHEAVSRWGAERVTHHWGAMDQVSADLLPLVGGLPGRSRVLVATGFSKWGITGGTVAADLLAAQVAGDAVRTPFSALRFPDLRGLGEVAVAGGRVGYEVLRDRIPLPGRTRPGRADGTPGEGRVVATPTGPVAVCTDAAGRTCAVSATCTHLGCTVRWNGSAGAWDCACHGSRFAADGEVLSGPATRPLAPRQVPGS